MGFLGLGRTKTITNTTEQKEAKEEEKQKSKSRLLATEGKNQGEELQSGKGESVRKVFGN